MVFILGGAVVAHVVLRLTMRVLVRRAVRRALGGHGRWRIRLPRPDDGLRGEQRRVQRADAAAHMLTRVSTLVITAVAVIAGSQVLGVSPLVLVSSAGFIGAGLAIGGQVLIRDWLTGLLVLLEDRYAVGDQVSMRVSGHEVEGTVEALNSAGVRLRLDDGTTWHAGHGAIESVTNRSQQLVVHHVDVPSDVWAQLDATLVGPRLKDASHNLGLTDVLLLADIDAEGHPDGRTRLSFKATRRLSERQRRLVVDQVLADGGERVATR